MRAGFRERMATRRLSDAEYLAAMRGETVEAMAERVEELEREVERMEKEESPCIGCGYALGCHNPACEFFVG